MTFNVTTRKRRVILSHHPEVKVGGIKELLELYSSKTDWPTNYSLVPNEILTTSPPKSISVTAIQITTERNHTWTEPNKLKRAPEPRQRF